MRADVYHWKNTDRSSENEDRYTVDEHYGLAMVADGVTRSVEMGDSYPFPSPTAVVAREAIGGWFRSASELLVGEKRVLSMMNMRDCMMMANLEASLKNVELGLHVGNDYFTCDRAGCTVAAVSVDEEWRWATYCYMTDCGVAVIDGDNILHFITPDDMKLIQPRLPVTEPLSESRDREGVIATRRDHRNCFRDSRVSYGVLNGEPGVIEHYLRVGTIALPGGSCLCLFTDGARWLVERFDTRRLLADGITNFERMSSRYEGEGTVIVMR